MTLVETVWAFGRFLVDHLPGQRSKHWMRQHAGQAHEGHARVRGELKPYLTGKGAVSVDLEPLAAQKPHRYVYEVARQELIAVERNLDAVEAYTIERGQRSSPARVADKDRP